MSNRGALIVFEGLDRAGKTTQCERLKLNLEKVGQKVKLMKFPNRTTSIGQTINAYLKGEQQIEDHVVHLLFSANRWEAAEQMRADIANGITLIVDRYYCSGVVYSVAKCNPSLDICWAYQPEIGLPKPDFCIFLDLSPADTAKRADFGGERYEEGGLQKRVRNLFPRILDLTLPGKFEILDGGQTLEMVEQSVLELSTRWHTCSNAILIEHLASLGPIEASRINAPLLPPTGN